MKKATTVLSLLLAALLAGCSSSQPVATTPTQSETSSTRAEASGESQDETTPPRTAPIRAPQNWYHLDRVTRSGPGLDTRGAYQTTLKGRPPQDTVQVAIIDSGTDIDHEDLGAAIWTNDDEVPGNDVDDDENGYVDDVHGWNFIGGPDGQNVDEDTYELTRIYADLNAQFGGVDSSAVPTDSLDAYRRYQSIKQTFQKKRREAKKKLKKVKKYMRSVDVAEKILKTRLQTDSLTQARVATVTSSNRRVQTAQNILLRYYKQGPESVQDYYDYLERQVEYNYNPDFNPRPIVGDDYSDKTQRHYGNTDVEGPDASHGTHVSGIVGALRNNGIGVNGIARGVELMPVRTVPKGDERDKDVANAIRYAVNNGADVINMSFGKAYSPHKEVVDDAVQYADSMDVLMIHAAGNDGVNVDSTKNYPTPTYLDGGEADLWIEVGASSWKGGQQLVAPFSNYGAETVDVFAPGHSIYSTVPNNRYDRNDGTSMAAPMVSGLAALIMAHYPSLSAEEVRSIILDTATRYPDQKVNRPGGSGTVPFGRLSETGAVVNARAAVQRASERAATE